MFNREYMTPLLAEEIIALSDKHYSEVVTYEERDPDISIDHYVSIEHRGALRTYTARKNKAIIGYAVYVVSYHPHYRKSLRAIQDAIYIDPNHRVGNIGVSFIQWTESKLAQEGVEYVYQSSAKDHDIGHLLIRMGYKPIESIYLRRLKK